MKVDNGTGTEEIDLTYGKVVESHPRQCIIIATVNGERGYLRDIIGTAVFEPLRFIRRSRKRPGTSTSISGSSSGPRLRKSGNLERSCISKGMGW